MPLCGSGNFYYGFVTTDGNDQRLEKFDTKQGKPPFKEVSKVSFVLKPYEDLLPHVPDLDG